LPAQGSMAEQPGALQLYPPSRGRFAVPRDHFRFTSAAQFDLTYLSYDAFARNARSPVLFYAGNEGAVELFYNNSGALFTLASRLGARLLFAEHRYYGSSLPFGAASFTPANLSLLSVEQALADYAALLLALPAELGCRSARPVDPSRPLCDTVLFGGSYGGMLAAWHRVRYPHLSLGAVASGAPVDFYDGVQSRFAAAVNRTFAVYGGKGSGCSSALHAALAAADAATPSQLVAAGVRPCDPMGGDAVERYAFYARGAMASTAMLDYPYQSRFVGLLPPNPVRRACGDLLAPGEPLRRLHSAVLHLVNGTGALRCVDLRAELVGGRLGRWADGSDLGVQSWNYQAVSRAISASALHRLTLAPRGRGRRAPNCPLSRSRAMASASTPRRAASRRRSWRTGARTASACGRGPAGWGSPLATAPTTTTTRTSSSWRTTRTRGKSAPNLSPAAGRSAASSPPEEPTTRTCVSRHRSTRRVSVRRGA